MTFTIATRDEIAERIERDIAEAATLGDDDKVNELAALREFTLSNPSLSLIGWKPLRGDERRYIVKEG